MKETKQKGITLIALVITIIVLLILAGVTIAMLSGNNSAPQKATEAAQKDAIAAAKDEVAMEVQEALLNYYNNTYVATSAAGSSTTANTQSVVEGAATTAIKNVKDRNSNILSSSKVENHQITINTKSYTETGTISDKGAITWNGIVAANNGGEQSGNNQGGTTPTTSEATGVTVINETNKTSLKEGEKLNLSAKIEPEGATGTIEWVCDPEDAVTFNPTTGTSTTATAVKTGNNIKIKARLMGKSIISTAENIRIDEATPIPGGTKEATSEKAQAINAKIGTLVEYKNYPLYTQGTYTGDWKVFYATNNEMFITPTNCSVRTATPRSSPINPNQAAYTGSEDVKNSGYNYGKNWNSIWLAECTTENTAENAKRTAYLCDYRNWEEYVLEGTATYAVGGPTIELFEEAIAASGGTDGRNSLTATSSGYSAPSLTIPNCFRPDSNPYRYWLASPSNYNGYKGRDQIRCLYYASGIGNDSQYDSWTYWGIKPLVSIPINKVTVNENTISIQ